jgi:hypothetical protein
MIEPDEWGKDLQRAVLVVRDECSVGCVIAGHHLGADEGRPIPLNWVLANATARFIWTAFTDDQVSNATEITVSTRH